MTIMEGKTATGIPTPILVSADGTVATTGGGGGGGGGGGDASAANQVLLNGYVGTTTDAVVAAGAAGSLSAKLRRLTTDIGALVTGTVLAAGAAIIGKVGIDQTTPGTTDSVSVKSSGFAPAVTVTRPANVTAYTAGDVVGGAFQITGIGNASKPVVITDCDMEIHTATAIASAFRLHLYNVTPPSALADNAVFDLPSGDRAAYLGYLDLVTPTDLGSTLYSQNSASNKGILVPASGNVFGYLQNITGFTPSENSTVYEIRFVSTGL